MCCPATLPGRLGRHPLVQSPLAVRPVTTPTSFVCRYLPEKTFLGKQKGIHWRSFSACRGEDALQWPKYMGGTCGPCPITSMLAVLLEYRISTSHSSPLKSRGWMTMVLGRLYKISTQRRPIVPDKQTAGRWWYTTRRPFTLPFYTIKCFPMMVDPW